MAHIYELKKLSKDGIAAAMEKAERYRLLNEPQEAESICLDVLAVDPQHAHARITLILALSDLVGTELARFDQAMEVVAHLSGFERAYYEGILCERRGKAHHKSGGPFAGNIAYDWFRRAMDCFEAASAAPSRPAGNEDAVLRWNTCARLLMRHADLAPRVEEAGESFLE
jgi:hypothetical protein